MCYFSARLLIVCLVDDGKSRKKNTCDYPFFLIQAKDHEEAFQRALELGKKQETRYENDKGQAVRWAFVRVEEVKALPQCLNGVEVGSLLDVLVTEKRMPFKQSFSPKNHRPLLT